MSCMFLPKVCAVVMFLFLFWYFILFIAQFVVIYMFVVVVILSFHTSVLFNGKYLLVLQYPSYTPYNFLDINYDLRGEKGKLSSRPVLIQLINIQSQNWRLQWSLVT